MSATTDTAADPAALLDRLRSLREDLDAHEEALVALNADLARRPMLPSQAARLCREFAGLKHACRQLGQQAQQGYRLTGGRA